MLWEMKVGSLMLAWRNHEERLSFCESNSDMFPETYCSSVQSTALCSALVYWFLTGVGCSCVGWAHLTSML